MSKKPSISGEKKKKPFFKKWWVWLIAVFVLIGVLLPKDADEAETDDTTVLDAGIVQENKTDGEPETEQTNTPTPTPEPTPEPTPATTPEPTPEATAAPTPEVTPEPTPEPTPDVTPVVIPEPEIVVPETPEPTPEVIPNPTPAELPELIPDVIPPEDLPVLEPTPDDLPVLVPVPVPDEPIGGGYIGNENSEVFHSPSCKTLPQEHNRVYFDARQQAVDAGYRPCGNCNP